MSVSNEKCMWSRDVCCLQHVEALNEGFHSAVCGVIQVRGSVIHGCGTHRGSPGSDHTPVDHTLGPIYTLLREVGQETESRWLIRAASILLTQAREIFH